MRQAQLPLVQLVGPVHTVPQVPQLSSSALVSTQAAPQDVRLLPGQRHIPALQVLGAVQARPQKPQ
jgi:hypothetical protein